MASYLMRIGLHSLVHQDKVGTTSEDEKDNSSSTKKRKIDNNCSGEILFIPYRSECTEGIVMNCVLIFRAIQQRCAEVAQVQ